MAWSGLTELSAQAFPLKPTGRLRVCNQAGHWPLNHGHSMRYRWWGIFREIHRHCRVCFRRHPCITSCSIALILLMIMLLWRLLLLVDALFRVPVIIYGGGEAAIMFAFFMHSRWLMTLHLLMEITSCLMVMVMVTLDNNLRFSLLHSKWSRRNGYIPTSSTTC